MKAYSLDLREKIVAAVGRGMSTSVSVLFVLERFLESYPPGSGEYGTISALGPSSPRQCLPETAKRRFGRRLKNRCAH